jgi:hypothetical protein
MEDAEAEVLEEARDAMREIARELARFFASTGIDARAFDVAFRAELIASLAARLKQEGTEPTVARIALLAGMPKSAVEQALATRSNGSEATRSQFSERGLIVGLATLASLWTSDTRFTAMYGVPRHLPLRRSRENAESLEYLAELALPGVAFDRVVHALSEHGLIEIDAQQSTASLVSQTVFFRNLDAQVVSHYGRMVSGLMRNLRINRERRHETAEDKPWNCALVMDRPIADSNVGAFIEMVSEGGDRWFRSLEATELTYSARHGEQGRRYAVCAFVSPDVGDVSGGTVLTPIGELASPKLYVRSMVTTNCIGGHDVDEFRRHVAHSGQAWLGSIDAEHKTLLAPPGESGTRLVVCCFLFDVTGSAQTAEEAIDLLDARVTKRRIAKY